MSDVDTRDTPDRDISEQVQRTLAVIEALAGNEFSGMAVVELAQATRQRADQVVRTLANLIHRGWAEKMDNGRYRLAAKPVQIALAFSASVSRAESQLADVKNRYTRQP